MQTNVRLFKLSKITERDGRDSVHNTIIDYLESQNIAFTENERIETLQNVLSLH